MTEDEMVGWHHRLDGPEFEQALGVGDWQGSLVCCSPWGCIELDMNEQLLHGTNIPGFYAILFFITLDFTSLTSHIHNWVLFLLWLHLFILSGVISPFFFSSILGTYWPRSLSFSVLPCCLFILLVGFLRQEYWSGLPFPSPVDHILSELSTMTLPS